MDKITPIENNEHLCWKCLQEHDKIHTFTFGDLGYGIGSNDAKIRTPKVEYVDITSSNLLAIILAESVINDGTVSTPVYNISVAKLTSDGSPKTKLTQGAVVDENVYTYTSATKTLAFEADTLAVGDKLMIAYEYETADAAAVIVKSNEYPWGYKCSVCNNEKGKSENLCLYCGAKTGGENNDT